MLVKKILISRRHFLDAALRACSVSKKQKRIKVKSFQAPKALPGIDFSDHLNYWRFGYSSLMITDTSFYRNKNYYQVLLTINISMLNMVYSITLYYTCMHIVNKR